jgi:probable phosphoglycerate mutase
VAAVSRQPTQDRAGERQPTTVLLVRHGETEWNRDGRIQGWAPAGLTDRGRDQARTLGESLAEHYGVDRLVASDLRRTRETTALLREAGVGPAPTFDRGWRERDVGVLQGLDRERLFGRHPEYRATSGVMAARATPEGGESMLDLRKRVLDAWDRLFSGATAGETVLVVTHGGPIYVLLGHVRGLDLPGAFLEHSHHNCGLTELRAHGAADTPAPDKTGSGDGGSDRSAEHGGVEIVRENERRGSADGTHSRS